MINEAEKSIELDSVIQVFHSWYRDQEIQQSNDNDFIAKALFIYKQAFRQYLYFQILIYIFFLVFISNPSFIYFVIFRKK